MNECEISEIELKILIEDQQYLLDISYAVKSGSFPEDLSVCEPGPLSHSRRLTTANRVLRLYLSIENPTDEYRILVSFILKSYMPVWFHIKKNTANECIRNLSVLGLETNPLTELIIINHCVAKLHEEIVHRWELTLNPDSFPTLKKNPDSFPTLKVNPDSFPTLKVNPDSFPTLKELQMFIEKEARSLHINDSSKTKTIPVDKIRDNNFAADGRKYTQFTRGIHFNERTNPVKKNDR
ncbi:hypothetical protein AVEN_236125-1 [Araneus ventricosus]|uniref:Uncharacterized protein n=1 Tax=Araneus ventricosus TaxID=182803 RepID=A0A4Y2FYL4_ARAVE|nr:hypothetical protein AVEN_236125-1 [Araneus ventricosus]